MIFYIAWGVIVGFCIGGIFELRRSQRELQKTHESWMDYADRAIEMIEDLEKHNKSLIQRLHERDTE